MEKKAEAAAAPLSLATDPGAAAPPRPAEPSAFNPPLPTRTDDSGQTIHVESERPDGKPLIWYKYDRKGQKMRFERKGYGVFATTLASGSKGS